jgi:hypothetical protein
MTQHGLFLSEAPFQELSLDRSKPRFQQAPVALHIALVSPKLGKNLDSSHVTSSKVT